MFLRFSNADNFSTNKLPLLIGATPKTKSYPFSNAQEILESQPDSGLQSASVITIKSFLEFSIPTCKAPFLPEYFFPEASIKK